MKLYKFRKLSLKDQMRIEVDFYGEPVEIDEDVIEGIMMDHAESTLNSEYKFESGEGSNEITASSVNITKAAEAIKQLLT